MAESILNSIKKLLNIPTDDSAFDEDIIVLINSVFMVLNQLGVGPTTVYQITGPDEEWVSFIPDIEIYSAVKAYVYLKVKMAFDPPATSFVLAAIENQVKELDWRLMVQAEPLPVPEV